MTYGVHAANWHKYFVIYMGRCLVYDNMGLTKQQKQERRWKEMGRIAMAALRRISTEPEFSLLQTSMDVF